MRSAWPAVVLVTWAACREQPERHAAPAPAPSVVAPALPSSVVSASAHAAAEAPPAPEPRPSAAAPAHSAGNAGGVAALAIADLPIDVAPAGPAAASAEGVVLATRSGQLQVARLVGLTGDAQPVETRIATLGVAGGDLVALGRAPSVSGAFAYWVQGSQLRRARLAGGPPEVLANDARDGTRTSALELGRATVAYVATAADRQIARLWVEGGAIREITPEGGNASSVTLAPTADGALALSIDPHLGMTPLHARPISASGQALGADVVAWVTGTAQPLTEVRAVGLGDRVLAFVAIERDSSQFGLARVAIDAHPATDSPATWKIYANGLDPAPASAAIVCGRPLVAYARPVNATPHAANEIVVASADGAELGNELVVALARATNDVTLAAVPRVGGGRGGALVTWVADRRTWAATLRCKH